ncbi:ECF-type sigma factor [Engelhardtia mirabilis]|uniref:RNA polymerase sigma factor n=1 Tax=Engelhardtia mirabilis TaxID=2528011 RepID=A0A518BDP3_9BACT|nr:RNA polymerase sigma factor [Planctomycetes bacterium Pla133]QDU99435.1 RNA polymerase sigma factor [Planctomycetes bacterium Pla86]
MTDPGPEVPERALLTRILHEGAEGSEWSRLLPLVYDELHGMARRQMGRERSDHTLQATALVHEAYMRLVGDVEMDWKGRGHFFGAASQAMRRVLVDHARKVGSAKRGGDRARVSISVDRVEQELENDSVLALDEALTTLEAEDPRAAEVARMRYFAGLEVREVALALDISERTVAREWAYARARLAELIGDEA